MRNLISAILLLCAVGVARAAAVAWDNLGTSTANGSITLSGGNISTNGSIMTYAAVISGVSNTSVGTLFAINSSGTNNPKVFFKVGADGRLGWQFGGSTPAYFEATDMRGSEKHAIAFTVDRSGDSNLITMYLDGTVLFSAKDYTSVTGNGGFGNSASLGNLIYGQDFNNGNTFGGNWDVYAYGGAVNASDITVANIPEPTVLALLALGVAGLALRRRAA